MGAKVIPVSKQVSKPAPDMVSALQVGNASKHEHIKAIMIKSMRAKITDIHVHDAYYNIKHRYVGVIGTASRIIPMDKLPADMRHAFPQGDWSVCDFLPDEDPKDLPGEEHLSGRGWIGFHAVKLEEVVDENNMD